MKSFGIIHIFLLIIILLVYRCANAQDFVVTSKGDTLMGEVKPLFYGVDKKVQLSQEGKKKAVYPMFQVRSFLYKGELYQPVKGPEGYTFMKLQKPGYLSLYSYQLPNQITFDGLYLLKMDGKGTEVPNISFKKVMERFLSDCPEVSEKIDKGDLSKKELYKIIDEYNACIGANTIDHGKIIADRGVWDVLEQKVKAEPEFEGKSNALDMIAEIKGKVARSEKVPNFLVEGLKSTLTQETFKVELENALKEIN
ncbi:MAG TPA: hypothetical protein VK589_05920 [Chryseolinea sp.]|nr:hypothetical protein [Chryseolinea sp.]